MKKIYAFIVLLTFSSSVSAQMIILDCKDLLNDQKGKEYQTIRIDTRNKLIDMGFGFAGNNGSKIVEEKDHYFKARYLNLDSMTIYVDRYSGAVKVLHTFQDPKGQKKITLDESYKCTKANKKF